MTEVALKQLLAQSRQLTTHILPGDLPQIERGLEQIESKSRKLAAKANHAGEGDTRAHYFLAGAGINAEELSENLNSVNLATTFEPLEPVHDTDIEGYLRHQHEQVIVSAIEEGRRETLRDFDTIFSRHLNADWERTKKRIFEELGQHQGGSFRGGDSMWGNTSMRLGKSSTMRPITALAAASGISGMTANSRMNRYALEIEKLNNARVQRTPYPILHALEGAAGDLKTAQVQQAFKILQYVIGEKQATQHTAAGPGERVFAKAYLRSTYDSQPAVELREKFVMGARKQLEESYLAFIEDQIRQFPEAAQLGGVPSLRAKIRAYLNVKYMKYGTWQSPHLERISGQPVYAITYFLLRTGHAQEALDYLSSHENQMPPQDHVIIAGLHQYVDHAGRRLSREMRNNILQEYNARFRHAKDVDPYMLALYKIVGRCDLSKKSIADVITSTQDWMWLQLTLIREAHDPEEPVHERYRLRDLQTSLLRFGARHFDPKDNNPLHYAHILLQSAQFEQAIGFLYSYEQYRIEAVELAVALAYYGLLRVSEKPDAGDPDILTTGSDIAGEETSYINFARMCQHYARSMQKSTPRYALHYLFAVCLYARGDESATPVGKEYTRLCYAAIRDLLFSVREYDQLLGAVNYADGSRTPGFIEAYMALINIDSSEKLKAEIVKKTANKCSSEGSLMDAIKLYNLADDYDTVVFLFNKELGTAFQQLAHGTTSVRLPASVLPDSNLKEYAKALVDDYYLKRPEIAVRITTQNKETYRVLTELLEFMREFQAGQLEQALQRMEKMNFIPLDGEVHAISRIAADFRSLDEVLAGHLGDILISTMTIILQLYERHKGSAYGDVARQTKMAELRQKANAVNAFASMIKYRLKRDTYATLSRLDVFIK